MPVQTENIRQSEKKILAVLTRHSGRMEMSKLLEAMKKAGLEDDLIIRTAVWHLIAQSVIVRDADTLALPGR